MHLVRDEASLQLGERLGVFPYDVEHLCRPVGQSQYAVSLGFQLLHQWRDARHFPREDVGVMLVQGVDGVDIIGPLAFPVGYIFAKRLVFLVDEVVVFLVQDMLHKPLGLLFASQLFSEESLEVVLHKHSAEVKNDILNHGLVLETLGHPCKSVPGRGNKNCAETRFPAWVASCSRHTSW